MQSAYLRVAVHGTGQVDRDLKDWDLSGYILTYISEASMELQTMRTEMMYNAEALYTSCRIAEPSPMKNRLYPVVNPDFGLILPMARY